MPRILVLCFAWLLVACSQPEDPPLQGPVTAAMTTESDLVAPQPARKVIIAADPWCPHNCGAGSDREGYIVDIAREAFAMAGIEVEYINMSWARALQQARDGYIDGVVGALPGDAPDFIFPEEAAGHTEIALYTHPDSTWHYSGIDSLEGLNLLAINGYAYSPELDAYIDRHRDDPEKVWILSGPAPLGRAIGLLGRHRSDVFPEDRFVMEWQLTQHSNAVALRRAAVIHKSPVYIAFSPARSQSMELAERLSQGTKALRDSGRIKQILASYGLSWSD